MLVRTKKDVSKDMFELQLLGRRKAMGKLPDDYSSFRKYHVDKCVDGTYQVSWSILEEGPHSRWEEIPMDYLMQPMLPWLLVPNGHLSPIQCLRKGGCVHSIRVSVRGSCYVRARLRLGLVE